MELTFIYGAMNREGFENLNVSYNLSHLTRGHGTWGKYHWKYSKCRRDATSHCLLNEDNFYKLETI